MFTPNTTVRLWEPELLSSRGLRTAWVSTHLDISQMPWSPSVIQNIHVDRFRRIHDTIPIMTYSPDFQKGTNRILDCLNCVDQQYINHKDFLHLFLPSLYFPCRCLLKSDGSYLSGIFGPLFNDCLGWEPSDLYYTLCHFSGSSVNLSQHTDTSCKCHRAWFKIYNVFVVKVSRVETKKDLIMISQRNSTLWSNLISFPTRNRAAGN